MSKHFAHLHLHTDFSLLDGAITLDKLVAFGKEHHFAALGISDHGNIFGAVKFFEKCKKAGIKPILGMEAYITEDAAVRSVNNKYYHLLLIVQNEIGYKNLCKLISYSFKKGFYFKNRIDYAELEQHAEGLIASSACLGGHLPQLLLKNNKEEADKLIAWFMRVFPGRFYLEVQPEDQPEQIIVNKQLYELSAQKNIPLIATCDSHYVADHDHDAHELLLAIQTHDTVDNPDRYSFGQCRVHLRTQNEMLELFKDHEEAVWNTGAIADQCEFTFQTGKLFFPVFEVPAGHTQQSFFEELCRTGFQALKDDGRIPVEKYEDYTARLELEIELIVKMGFVGYFLVVSDFIQWARRNGVPVGPGRGSAAGSLVAWSLEITNIDPIKYNLLFERFLNPERVSMPDIDIDFCIEGRERVIDYVRDKYGHDNVCQIITFGTMLAKAVIKDAARALGMPFEDSNMITKLIPEQLKITLKEAIEQEPRLNELIEGNPKVKHLFDLAFRLEGLTRHASKHAAGIVISPEPIDSVLPVYIPPKTDELVTQYAMTELESLGFLKIDFLGLKNLTLIDRAVRLIEKNHGVILNMNKLPLDDAKTFQLICDGKTSGVFQLESDGLKDVLRKLQPEKFEDIIAVNALYRPGPLGSGMVDDFIERRHGRQQISYLFPELEPVLKETYGVIVYQEQVMKVASAIAGFTLGQADILRRAMGKKKADVMEQQKELFIQGAQKNSFDTSKAGELFDLMAYFAGYGFNKSHSAAYALIAYQTAYLKANYPAEFMAYLISLESDNSDKMAFYLDEAKTMGLSILAPHINQSEIDFSVIDGKILFGLKGIKSVGLAALENILQERTKKPFLDLLDLCKRIDLRKANKRVLEHLIYAGAFDTLPGSRAQQADELQQIMDCAAAFKETEATGQMGLFGTSEKQLHEPEAHAYQSKATWNDQEKLEKEKEVIGFYLSAHPLDSYKKQLRRLPITAFNDALTQSQQHNSLQEITTIGCGFVKSRRDILTKKGDRMSFVQLEDASGSAEIIVFPKVFKKIEPWLDEYHVFLVKGQVDTTSDRKCKIKAQEFVPLDLVMQEWSALANVTLQLPSVFDESDLQKLKDLLGSGKISLNILFHENGKKLCLATKTRVFLNNEIVNTLEISGIDVQIKL
jgi:DNA polymerase III subunit alpha